MVMGPSYSERVRKSRVDLRHLEDQLDLERHAVRTTAGVCARIAPRILALTTAIWHNDHLGQPVLRPLTAYDH